MKHMTALALLVAACSHGNAGGPSALPLLPFEDAPSYAVHCDEDHDDPVVHASTHYDMFVYCALKDSDPLVNAVLPLSASGQGVQVGRTDEGAVFVIVATTDYEEDVGSLVVFVDEDDDDLPDAESETTVATVMSAHLGDAAYDPVTGSIYVVDALNNRILRWNDNDGDKIPNGGTQVTFLGSGGVLTGDEQLVEVSGASSVEVFVRRLETKLQQSRLIVPLYRLMDTDTDGVADMVQEIVPTVFGPPAEIRGVPFGGDDEVTVVGAADVQYELRADDELVATFTATGSPEPVSLSRALDPDEVLELIESGQQVSAVAVEVGDPTTPFVSHIDDLLENPPHQGGSMTVRGEGLTGDETVEMALDEEGELVWRTATITSSSSEHLTFTVPTALGIAMGAQHIVVLRVTPDVEDVLPFTRRLIVTN